MKTLDITTRKGSAQSATSSAHMLWKLSLVLSAFFACPVWAADAASSGSSSAGANSADSDKLNVKLLEEKYWSAKDTDFSVVQNRAYSKEGRFYLNASYGVLMNDQYSTGRMTNFALGYYPSERWGFEIAQENGNLKQNSQLSTLASQYGALPNYNKFVSDTSINAIWVPLYAKMSFMNRSIMYFDMQFAAGIGQLTYQQQIKPTEGPNTNANTTAYNLDVTQQLFFSDHFALRLDIKNKWSTEQVKVYQLTNSQYTSRNGPGSNAEQDTTILLGITYFFGSKHDEASAPK